MSVHDHGRDVQMSRCTRWPGWYRRRHDPTGNDGIVILPDGTKYVSSVRFGSVSQIRPGQPAKVIAAGIPSAASMGYDSKQKQLIIPMNNNNAVAFIKLTD